MPGIEVAREHAKTGETISAFLSRTQWATKDRTYGWQFRNRLPTIIEVDGEPLLRKDWGRKRIRSGDFIRLVSVPLGGGGSGATKQVIGMVALIAASAFAGPLGGAIAGALSLPAIAGTFIGAGIALGSSLDVNNVLPISFDHQEFYNVSG